MAVRKKSVEPVCRKARGQFPKSPAGWSNLEAQGMPRVTAAVVSGIRCGGVIALYLQHRWGRGSFGDSSLHPGVSRGCF